MSDEGGVVKDSRTPEEIKNEVEDERIRKHAHEKDQVLSKLPGSMYPFMRHYLNCGMNILLYGVGSKRKFLNLFTMKHVVNEPTLVINGFHSAASMKSVTNPMLSFAFKKKI